MRAQQPSHWAGVAEALVSLCCVTLIGFVAVNGFGAYFCLDPAGCPEPHGTPVVAYRVAAGLLGAGVLTAVGLAVRRRARWAYLWHGGVALAAVVAVLLCAVPSIDWHALRNPEPHPPSTDYVPCYSGSGDCPGG